MYHTVIDPPLKFIGYPLATRLISLIKMAVDNIVVIYNG